MAIHKVKVIGPREVNGTRRGRTTTLDDEQVNVAALVDAGHVKLLGIVEPKKGDD